MPRLCECGNASPGPWAAGQCRRCWAWLNLPTYRRVHGGRAAPRVPLTCVHEEGVLEWAPCNCEAKHVRGCAVHDRCTRGKNNGAVASCLGCPDRAYPPDAPPRVGDARHLLYYVLPVQGNGVWRERLDFVKARLSLFTGKKVVAVAESLDGRWANGRLDAVSSVEAHLKGQGCEIVPVLNDGSLRETVAWESLWSRLQDHGPGDVAWFAHAKGVSKPVNPGVTVHEWARVMGETNLDYWPLVRDQLRRHPITGSFKKLGAGFFNSHSAWHYSGTNYWVRLDDFFARDWRGKVDRTWWGTESYPGVAYGSGEAGCLFHEAPVAQMNLYVWRTWRERVLPAYAAWKEANKHHHKVWGPM